MIDTVKCMEMAREKAHEVARWSYPPTQPERRRMVFETAVVREFADRCLPGGYASLVSYTLTSGSKEST